MSGVDWTRIVNNILPDPGGEDTTRIRTGVVDDLNSDGTADVAVSGLVVPNLPVVDGVNLSNGDTVMLITYRGQLIVLGRTRQTDTVVNTVLREGPLSGTQAGWVWTKPAGLRYVRVRVVGGGGGASGVAATSAGQVAVAAGGGGACYAESLIQANDLPSSLMITVGAGGPGGSAGSNNGSAGYTSSFGSLVIASGGKGGSSSVELGVPPQFSNGRGEGGTTGTGDIVISGDAASPGVGLSTSRIFASTGGKSALGGASFRMFSVSASREGAVGDNYGSGATGGFNAPSESARAGDRGGRGVVIVEEFF